MKKKLLSSLSFSANYHYFFYSEAQWTLRTYIDKFYPNFPASPSKTIQNSRIIHTRVIINELKISHSDTNKKNWKKWKNFKFCSFFWVKRRARASFIIYIYIYWIYPQYPYDKFQKVFAILSTSCSKMFV